MKRYAMSLIRYLIFYSLGFIVFLLLGYLTRAAHALFADWLPTVFRELDPIYDREGYRELTRRLDLVAAALSLYTVTHLSAVYDNERFEHLISRTDGFYTVREGLSLYLPRYAVPDLISAVTVPLAASALALISLPDTAPVWARRLVDMIDGFLSIQNAFTEGLGVILGISLLLLLSIAFRLPAAYFAVLRFRGVWLSDTEGGGVIL